MLTKRYTHRCRKLSVLRLSEPVSHCVGKASMGQSARSVAMATSVKSCVRDRPLGRKSSIWRRDDRERRHSTPALSRYSSLCRCISNAPAVELSRAEDEEPRVPRHRVPRDEIGDVEGQGSTDDDCEDLEGDDGAVCYAPADVGLVW